MENCICYTPTYLAVSLIWGYQAGSFERLVFCRWLLRISAETQTILSDVFVGFRRPSRQMTGQYALKTKNTSIHNCKTQHSTITLLTDAIIVTIQRQQMFSFYCNKHVNLHLPTFCSLRRLVFFKRNPARFQASASVYIRSSLFWVKSQVDR